MGLYSCGASIFSLVQLQGRKNYMEVVQLENSELNISSVKLCLTEKHTTVPYNLQTDRVKCPQAFDVSFLFIFLDSDQ